jgi:hypothetical protein
MKGRICLIVLFTSVLLILTPQTSLAEKKGTNRPLSGSFVGGALIDPVNIDGCPGGYAYVVTIALGNLSHLGLTQAHFTHCSNPSGDDYKNEVLILTAANGDELWATYIFKAQAAGHIIFEVSFSKGTGRFENATGTAILDAQVQPVIKDGNPDFSVPWPWQATLAGKISY